MKTLLAAAMTFALFSNASAQNGEPQQWEYAALSISGDQGLDFSFSNDYLWIGPDQDKSFVGKNLKRSPSLPLTPIYLKKLCSPLLMKQEKMAGN